MLISLHYHDLYNHKERINQLNKYINNYNFKSSDPSDFEKNNICISLTVYNEHITVYIDIDLYLILKVYIITYNYL